MPGMQVGLQTWLLSSHPLQAWRLELQVWKLELQALRLKSSELNSTGGGGVSTNLTWLPGLLPSDFTWRSQSFCYVWLPEMELGLQAREGKFRHTEWTTLA